MAWFITTTLGNLTQKTKHQTKAEVLSALAKALPEDPKETYTISVRFNPGPQAAIAAKQAKEQ